MGAGNATKTGRSVLKFSEESARSGPGGRKSPQNGKPERVKKNGAKKKRAKKTRRVKKMDLRKKSGKEHQKNVYNVFYGLN